MIMLVRDSDLVIVDRLLWEADGYGREIQRGGRICWYLQGLMMSLSAS